MGRKKRGLFLVVLGFLLLVLPALAQAEDCLIYPGGDESLYCVPYDQEARTLCAEQAGCNEATHVVRNQRCSQIPSCQPVRCNALAFQGCRLDVPVGYCEQVNGLVVPEDQVPYYCAEGCCAIKDASRGVSFCSVNLNRFECGQEAVRRGVAGSSFFPDLAADQAACLQQCQVDFQAGSLSGYVINESGATIASAVLQLRGTERSVSTDGRGFYELQDLLPGSYALDVQAAGYFPTPLLFTLRSSEQRRENVTLQASGGEVSVAGTVFHGSRGLERARVSWEGVSSGFVITNADGTYNFQAPGGVYRVTASKAGYRSAEQRINIATPSLEGINFVLTALAFQGVEGTVYVDKNGNGRVDVGEKQWGADLYVDGVFKGRSQYPEGLFRVSAEPGLHQLRATFENYEFEGEVRVGADGTAPRQDILLTTYRGECSLGQPGQQKVVSGFVAGHVLGRKEVRLQWQKPCAEVVGYEILRKRGSLVLGSPLSAGPTDTSLADSEVEWGQSYTYEIVARFQSGLVSAQPAVATITMGDAFCEGRYHAGWDTFCLGSNSKLVYTCDATNKVLPSGKDCNSLGGSYFCAPLSATRADCKNAVQCSIGGGLFGMYHTRDACYGTTSPQNKTAPNFCYYDSSDTVVNQCSSCANVNCFEYKSKDACEVNNCYGKSCAWVDAAAEDSSLVQYNSLFPNLTIPAFVTAETGAGYCVEENYKSDDQCSLCGKQGAVFENYFCTAEVCSGLGRCFSNSVGKPLSSCSSCGEFSTPEVNCYSYTTELECTGGSSIRKNSFQRISYSQDQCGWGRCAWLGSRGGAGRCVKDGDANRQDDCSAFRAGEITSCRADTSAPRTKIISDRVAFISLVSPNLTLEGDDSYHAGSSQRSSLGKVFYCLTSAEPSAPDRCESGIQGGNYLEVSYPGVQTKETTTLPALRGLTEEINGKIYKLRFFSTDRYFNQEDVNEALLFIDNVAPQYTINEEIQTAGDVTSLTVFLEGTSEPMNCSFDLTPINPQGSTLHQEAGRDADKRVTFGSLEGIRFDLNVSCQDDHSNSNSRSKQYVFDLEQGIEIVSPSFGTVVAATAIPFEVRTAVGATCKLYQVREGAEEFIADFQTDSGGKTHRTSSIPGFVEGRYPGVHKVICQELLTADTLEDYFDFTVDFTPPQAQIVLSEGSRESRPVRAGWEEFFVRAAAVDFLCLEDGGFPCASILYCLGNSCGVPGAGYIPYASRFSVNTTTPICYYATDSANNPIYQPTCGNIIVEGFGAVLESPLPHYYFDELWGISDEPMFDVRFFTRVPTAQCRYDFTPGFLYNATPGYRVLEKGGDGRYTISNFPRDAGASSYAEAGGVKEIYLQCRAGTGEIGPEQKITLEYDPSAPEIQSAIAEPNPLLEGNTLELTVSTDDKTLCKYSDAGHDDYDLMPYAFPGAEADLAGHAQQRRVLQTEHTATYALNGFRELQGEFMFTVTCKNGAGQFSSPHNITVRVDYTQAGGIRSVYPHGEFLNAASVLLRVETSKNALCSLRTEDGTFVSMEGSGTRVHTLPLGNVEQSVEEKYHQYPVRCRMGDHFVEDVIRFTIDRTAPILNRVDDGRYTCGGQISVMIYSNETNITEYYYEVYDRGEVSGRQANSTFSDVGNASLSRSAVMLVLNGTSSGTLPVQIPAAGLQRDHLYFVKVRAVDAAGNLGQFRESDGVQAVAANFTACEEDETPPAISVLETTSCTATAAELHCGDDVGCREIRYGQALASSSCVSNSTYAGQQISFSSSGWLCYAAVDAVGNNLTGSSQVLFLDDDGDGVANNCDTCSGTDAGEVVDSSGCANGQVPSDKARIDTDGDGLPDYWEKQYDSFSCSFSYASVDSDSNGVSDTDEDYDQDSFSAYAEYTARSDPCSAADSPPLGDERTDVTPPTTPTEGGPGVAAWIFLILGLVFSIGGIGYLFYYYRFSPAGRVGTAVGGKSGTGKIVSSSNVRGRSNAAISSTSLASKSPLLVESKQGLSLGAMLGRSPSDRTKQRRREELFGKFNSKSSTIPHVEAVLQEKAAPLPKLQKLAQTYVNHKDEIVPGLRREEKGIFAKLEGIARQTTNKKIHEISSVEEARDIFSKLRGMSSKRKAK